MRRTLLLMLVFAVALAACGRRGELEPPTGAEEDPRLEDYEGPRR